MFNHLRRKKYLLDYSKPKPDKMVPQTTETRSIGASPKSTNSRG